MPKFIIRRTASTPTLQSPKYEGPIQVKETTDFTFRTFRPNGKAGDISRTRFIKSEYAPATTVTPSAKGLQAEWYEFKGNSVQTSLKHR